MEIPGIWASEIHEFEFVERACQSRRPLCASLWGEDQGNILLVFAQSGLAVIPP